MIGAKRGGRVTGRRRRCGLEVATKYGRRAQPLVYDLFTHAMPRACRAAEVVEQDARRRCVPRSVGKQRGEFAGLPRRRYSVGRKASSLLVAR